MLNPQLTLTKELTLQTHISAAWDAIVNPEKIKYYLFGTETITDWKPGSPIIFQGEYQGTVYKDKGVVLEIIAEKMLKYSYWTVFYGLEDQPENYSTIMYVLEASGDNTLLKLTQTGFKDETAMQHSIAGWDVALGKMKEIAEK